jgi:multimeric flavodoxin WrbA
MAVVYHSGRGRTEYLAGHVVSAARETGTAEVSLLRADELTGAPERLADFDGIIWGSPTHFGGVSGPFKVFMDATSAMWRDQNLQGKLAAGFTVSGYPSGDKQSTLLSMLVFSMQHGMIWVGNPLTTVSGAGSHAAQAPDRLGSWTGAMAQVDPKGPVDGFAPEDVEGARAFGGHFARTLMRI